MAGPILLTGATGYVGGRLLTALEARGERVRCLVRRPEALAGRVGERTEVVQGDVLDAASVRAALDGVEVAYYLVHSMGGPGSFADADREAAATFGAAAREAGVRRVVYLGGLGRGELSPHLASRQEVGRILREAVATTEFRASVVIGSGSASFELVRALVDRLPVLVTPRWVENRAQPIAIEDVLAYLVAELDREAEASEVFEIGGADVVSYGELMREYGRRRGLRRLYVRVPVLTPWLSSLWLALVTPVYAKLGRALVESIAHDTVVVDSRALDAFPLRPCGAREAIARALANDGEAPEARPPVAEPSSGDSGGRRPAALLVDRRLRRVPQSPAAAFAPIRRIGGRTGWYYGRRLWQARGLLDVLAGGPGLRRGRRDPDDLRVGDAVDFWRVESYEPDRLLRLHAEMRVPGRAWLHFEVEPDEGGGSVIRQTALFHPRGLLGRVYWYAVWPLHGLVFGGMLDGIARAAAPAEGGRRRTVPPER